MLRITLALGLAAAGLAPLAQADVLLIERTESAREMDLPRRGELMTQVERRFGAPKAKHAAVGGASAVQPPITRWDYPDFSVYFENSHVVNSVMTKSNPLETGPKPLPRTP